MVVMLVEVTTVEQLIDRLRKGKYRSSSDVLAKSMSVTIPLNLKLIVVYLVVQSAAEDDDIVAGSQKMSLKCPVRYLISFHKMYSLILCYS